MSEGRRRQSRVQSGWAASKGPNKGSKASNTVTQPINTLTESTNDVSRSAEFAGNPSWTEVVPNSLIDCQNTFRFQHQPQVFITVHGNDAGQFLIQFSCECLKPDVETQVINCDGVYDISNGPRGVSRLRILTDFIEKSECKAMLSKLLNELPWQQETVHRLGETYQQPRMTAWFGEFSYSYSGITHSVNTEWMPLLRQLKERIQLNTGLHFNSLLANLYRDGHDHVAWHSDDEISLGPNPTIASLSFGDSRIFELRKKPPSGDVNDCTQFVKVRLDSGCLLIMEGAVQEDWQHRVPREYHDRGPRVNLTYRVILPDSGRRLF